MFGCRKCCPLAVRRDATVIQGRVLFMKKLLGLFLLAAPLLALPSQAHAFCCGPFQVDAGFKYWLRVRCGCHQFGGCGFPFGGCACGYDNGPFPWYSYWPYDAAFQFPAPTGCQYPYWPAGAAAAAQASPTLAPVPAPAPVQPTAFYPVSYRAGAAPSYWYGK
jgi:hypothetical protein